MYVCICVCIRGVALEVELGQRGAEKEKIERLLPAEKEKIERFTSNRLPYCLCPEFGSARTPRGTTWQG